MNHPSCGILIPHIAHDIYLRHCDGIGLHELPQPQPEILCSRCKKPLTEDNTCNCGRPELPHHKQCP